MPAAVMHAPRDVCLRHARECRRVRIGKPRPPRGI